MGKGVVGVKDIVDAAAKSGTKYFIIEQESYQGKTPLECADEDLKTMKKWGFDKMISTISAQRPQLCADGRRPYNIFVLQITGNNCKRQIIIKVVCMGKYRSLVMPKKQNS